MVSSMSRPYSEIDFSTQITDDRNWRLKEISDLKSAAERADGRLQRVLLRALVAICYAHWEGYVKFAASKPRSRRFAEIHLCRVEPAVPQESFPASYGRAVKI